MITEIEYRTLDESVEEASQIYFWQNAIGISSKFADGFTEYQSRWIDKRIKPFMDQSVDIGTMVFGCSVIKNKPVVMCKKR